MSLNLFRFGEEAPVLIVKEFIILPIAYGRLTLNYSRNTSESINLIEREFWNDDNWMNKVLIVLSLTSEEFDKFQSSDIQKKRLIVENQIGTSVKISKLLARSNPKPHFQIFMTGLGRIRVKSLRYVGQYYKVRYNQEDPKLDVNSLPNSVKQFQTEAQKFIKAIRSKLSSRTSRQLYATIRATPPEMYPDLLASFLDLDFRDKLELLRAVELEKRFQIFINIYQKKAQLIPRDDNRSTDNFPLIVFKKYGNFEDRDDHSRLSSPTHKPKDMLSRLRERLESGDLPQHARETAEIEFMKLEKMQHYNPEYHVSLKYLEFLLELPWSKSTKDSIDVKKARLDLDAEHYGMDKLKKRILEYLAVQSLKNDLKGPILCFVGPPGVGKTSIAKAIAETLGRKFHRISLGGVADQSEIRGHRRTYIGSLPGRILEGIKSVGVNNPVILLDEVDKLNKGVQGDPAGALMEVLDPEQNHSFVDHYLGISFDLSKVLFICTVNTTYTIPHALRDRLELIEVPGYTQEEKVEIAQRYLIPKQLKKHGLESQHLKIPSDSTHILIANYTREAGVRELERQIAAVCRAVAVRIAEARVDESVKTFNLDSVAIEEILGPTLFEHDIAERVSRPGTATGLAWTRFGGEILFVEVSKMKGTGKLTLTGSLGDVMKESAQLAINWIKSNLTSYGLDWEPSATDIHIHFPAGAVGKDGPSAGVTILTAIVSLLSKQAVEPDLAMTGEITLRGIVLPVGGIKEKVLAAHRAGIRKVMLPSRNKKSLFDLPDSLQSQIRFIFVSHIPEVIEMAFNGRVKPLSKL